MPLTSNRYFHYYETMNMSSVLRALTALSHESRLVLFRLLVEQGPSGIAAGRIAERLELPAPTTSFHLKELVNAGLATARPQSRYVYYSANYATMNELVAYLTENCCRREGDCASAYVPACAPSANAVAARERRVASRRVIKPSKRRVA